MNVWGSLSNVIPLFRRIFEGTFHMLLVATEEVSRTLKSNFLCNVVVV